ncbi:outer membrane protein [Aquisalimonas asiatica]|uniref:Outer membrane protein beta-barrel domain-containing protein n=1 Tax=Aquisalimonas asiatica TaxID=406100 RepID=A0A1H8U4R7_9GAMM|nr:outer membrane beta-barrel protein [Aquisalimonas asiatica]SEO98229.1 Outer membrane protein beta-barrel domain-containing protein [Aquisalimonas asiatica]
MLRTLLLAPLLVILPLGQAAALTTDDVRPYFVADAGMGYVDLGDAERDLDRIADDDDISGSTSTKNTSFAYILGIGWHIGPYVAIELNYFDLGEYDATFSADNNDALESVIDFSGFGARGIARWPLTESWSVDVGLGAAQMDTRLRREFKPGSSSSNGGAVERYSSTDVVMNASLGTQYRLSREWSLRAQYLYFNDVGDSSTGRDDIQVLTVGAQFFF